MNNTDAFSSRAMGGRRPWPNAGRLFVTLVGLLWFGLLVGRAATNYVAQGGQTPASPYTTWVTAASNIQDAINQTTAGDTVLVSNGVYETGGITNYPTGTVLTNRVAIYKAITVRSADNNPTNTIIRGAWDPATNGPAAVRCVWMTNGSTLIGFTLTNGATFASGGNVERGGGVSCQSINTTISNCVIAGNSAGMYGGGAMEGTLFNCTLSYNSTTDNHSLRGGGGAYAGILYNCTLISNRATTASGGGARVSYLFNCTIVGNRGQYYGGGANGSVMYNCTIVGNSGSTGGGVQGGSLYNCISWGNNTVDAGGTFNYSCGVGYTNGGSVAGNITNDPLFITNGSGYGTNHVAGNYRLRNVSPPLNAGTNLSWMNPPDVRSVDLDGLRRIDRFSGVVDMGCYEFMPAGTLFTGR